MNIERHVPLIKCIGISINQLKENGGVLLLHEKHVQLLLLFHDLSLFDDQSCVVELSYVLSEKNEQSEEDHFVQPLVYLRIV
jgi:hypothetical protein